MGLFDQSSEKLSYMADLCQLTSFVLNFDQSTLLRIQQMLLEQNEQYLEKILRNQEEIMKRLDALEGKK